MKKILVLSLLAFSSLMMVKCSSSKKTEASNKSTSVTPNSMSPADKIAALKSKYTPDQMEQGKTICETKCVKCHGFKDPTVRTVSKFERVLPSMIRKAELNDQEGALVQAYLISNAKPL